MSFPFEDSSVAPAAAAGTVTSVGGGVGITGTPDPIVGAGSLDLDINSLTLEATLAAGDLFPFVDVSVGTAPADQRKTTLADVTSFLSGSFQPLDADLSAIAALAGTGILSRTAANTWALTSGTSGEVLFWSTTGLTPDSDPKFFWNDTDKTLALGGQETTIVIATTTYNMNLAIHDESTDEVPVLVAHKHQNIAAAGPLMLFARSRGTEAAETVVADNDSVGRIIGVGYSGVPSTGYLPCASIKFEIDDPSPSGTEMGGAIVFFTSPTNNFTMIERARFSSDAIFDVLVPVVGGTSLHLRGSRDVTTDPVIVNSNATTIDGVRSQVSILDSSALSFNNAASQVIGIEVGSQNAVAGTWTIDTALFSAFGAGGRLFLFAPTIKNTASVARADMGTWAGLVFSPTFQADGASATFPATRAIQDTLTGSILNAGTLVLSEHTGFYSQPTYGAGTTATFRRGLWFRDRVGAGAQVASFAVDVDDQTVSTLGGAVRSAVAAGTGKYGVNCTGDADNVLTGGAQIAYAPGTTTVPTGYFATHQSRLILTGSQRLALEGTARFNLEN